MYGDVEEQATAVVDVGGVGMLAALCFTIVGFGGGYLMGFLAGLQEADRRAICFEICTQNAPLAISIIDMSFGDDAHDYVGFVGVYVIISTIVSWCFVPIFRFKYPIEDESSHDKADTDDMNILSNFEANVNQESDAEVRDDRLL